jgi:hypothetical protein
MRVVATLTAMLGVLAIASCGSSAHTTRSQPAKKRLPESVLVNASTVCGKQLWNGTQAPVVRTFTQPGHYPVDNALFVGHQRPLVLILARNCRAGVNVTLQPTGVAQIVDVARLSDGRTAGVTLQAIRAGIARVIAARSDQPDTLIRIRVRD